MVRLPVTMDCIVGGSVAEDCPVSADLTITVLVIYHNLWRLK